MAGTQEIQWHTRQKSTNGFTAAVAGPLLALCEQQTYTLVRGGGDLSCSAQLHNDPKKTHTHTHSHLCITITMSVKRLVTVLIVSSLVLSIPFRPVHIKHDNNWLYDKSTFKVKEQKRVDVLSQEPSLWCAKFSSVFSNKTKQKNSSTLSPWKVLTLNAGV